MERITCSESQTSSIKASIKQTRINKLGKYPYNKKHRVINFEIPPADHLTKKFILNSVECSRSNQNQLVMG
jgi:hypothetical protein